MQTWALSPAASRAFPASARVSPAVALADATDAIGEPGFAARALDLVNAAFEVDFLSVYGVNGDRVPRMFMSASRAAYDVSDDCFRSYQRGLYKCDRTFSVAKEMAVAGIPALTHWNEREMPSPHRDQIYRRHGIVERLSVVSADEQRGLLAINLYRYAASGGFRDRDFEAAESIGRPLLACVRKHLRVSALIEASSRTNDPGDTRGKLIARCPDLTERELDVCERLLRGWTYDGISHDLGLTVPTVKTYRARAFERLGIHFRSELFAAMR